MLNSQEGLAGEWPGPQDSVTSPDPSWHSTLRFHHHLQNHPISPGTEKCHCIVFVCFWSHLVTAKSHLWEHLLVLSRGGGTDLILSTSLVPKPSKACVPYTFFFFNTTNPFLPLSSTSCPFFSNYALWSYIGNPGQVNNSVTLIKKLFGLTASIYFSQNTVFPLMVTLQLNTWNQAHISHRDILWYLLETKVSWRDDYSSSCNLHTDRLVSSEIMCGKKGEFNAAFLPQQIHG